MEPIKVMISFLAFAIVLFSGCADQGAIIVNVNPTGGGSTPTPPVITLTQWFDDTFTNGELSNNAISINHALSSTDLIVQVFDGLGNLVYPTQITYTDINHVTLDFTGFGALSGTYSAIVSSKGVSSSAAWATNAFVNGDLNASGQVALTHGLNDQNVHMQAWDGSAQLVYPEALKSASVNSSVVDMTGATPISGSYKLVTTSGDSNATAKYTLLFSNADLSGNTLTVTHSLNDSKAQVFVFNNANELIIPTELTKTTNNQVLLDLTGLTPISGTWRVVVRAET